MCACVLCMFLFMPLVHVSASFQRCHHHVMADVHQDVPGQEGLEAEESDTTGTDAAPTESNHHPSPQSTTLAPPFIDSSNSTATFRGKALCA